MASRGVLPFVALGLEREIDHHDGILLHDADQQDDADHGDDAEIGVVEHAAPAARRRPAEGSVERMVIGWM